MVAIRIGMAQCRKHLGKFSELATRGEGVLLAKYGRPYAALVSPAMLGGSRPKPSFLTLRGTGQGLWG